MAPADASMISIVLLQTTSSTTTTTTTMTRYLNQASNRAIRRILLSNSWPSDSALNESFRKVMATTTTTTTAPPPQQRSNQQYIQDQLSTFQNLYQQQQDEESSMANDYYTPAEAYLQCVLSLATSGEESKRVEEVRVFWGEMRMCEGFFVSHRVVSRFIFGLCVCV